MQSCHRGKSFAGKNTRSVLVRKAPFLVQRHLGGDNDSDNDGVPISYFFNFYFLGQRIPLVLHRIIKCHIVS
jgi:hypothetical protein